MAIFVVTEETTSNKTTFINAVKNQLTKEDIDLILPFILENDSNYYVKFVDKNFIESTHVRPHLLEFNRSLTSMFSKMSFLIQQLDYRTYLYYDYMIFIYKN